MRLFDAKEWAALVNKVNRPLGKKAALDAIARAEKLAKEVPDGIDAAIRDRFADLRERAGDVSLREIFDVDARYRDAYAPRFGLRVLKNWDGSPSEHRGTEAQKAKLEDALNEEAIAHAAGHRAAGASFGEMIDRLFDRVREFFERIGNWLRGEGYFTAGDVFRKIQTGEIGGRAEGYGQPSDDATMFALSAKAKRLGAQGTAAQWVNRNEKTISDWRPIFKEGLSAAKAVAEQRFASDTSKAGLAAAVEVDLGEYLKNQRDNPGHLNPEVRQALAMYDRDPDAAARHINEQDRKSVV